MASISLDTGAPAHEPPAPWVISMELEAAVKVVYENTGSPAKIKAARTVITDDYFKWDKRRLKVDYMAGLMKVVECCMIGMFEECDYSGRCWVMPFFACWANVPLCCLITCCPCIATCVIDPHNMSRMSGESFETECQTMACMCCLYPCYRSVVRASFRKKYNIAGTPLTDCMQWMCCTSCTMMQESIELMAIPEMKYSIPFVNGSLNRAISNIITPTSVALSRTAKN